MINKINSAQKNVNFKSSMRSDPKLNEYIGKAKTIDLYDFATTLDILNQDGKEDIYFIKEDVYKFTNFGKIYTRPMLNLFKRSGEDFSLKRIASIIIGSRTLETMPENVISELSSILRRCCDNIRTDKFRKGVLENVKKLMV